MTIPEAELRRTIDRFFGRTPVLWILSIQALALYGGVLIAHLEPPLTLLRAASHLTGTLIQVILLFGVILCPQGLGRAREGFTVVKTSVRTPARPRWLNKLIQAASRQRPVAKRGTVLNCLAVQGVLLAVSSSLHAFSPHSSAVAGLSPVLLMIAAGISSILMGELLDSAEGIGMVDSAEQPPASNTGGERVATLERWHGPY